MAKLNYRFTIRAAYRRRIFLSAIEGVNGKLRLFLKPQKNLGYFNQDLASRIVQQKITIHESSRSAKYSTIHFTTICEGGTKLDQVQLTDAIKEKSGFALLQVKILPNLAMPHYELRSNDSATIYNIDDYDPKVFIFCYGVLIGPPGLHFAPSYKPSLQAAQYHFQEFSIVLLWCFLSQPSQPLGTQHSVFTVPPERAATSEEEAILRETMQGKSADDCIAAFEHVRNLARTQHLNAIAKGTNQSHLDREQWEAMSVFFRRAKKTRAFYDHVRNVSRRFDL